MRRRRSCAVARHGGARREGISRSGTRREPERRCHDCGVVQRVLHGSSLALTGVARAAPVDVCPNRSRGTTSGWHFPEEPVVLPASSRPATGIEGLPCPTTGYVLCVPGIGAIRARSHKRDLRAIVGARRGHSAGRDGARAEIDADDVPPHVVVASRSAEAWGESGGPRRQQCRGWGSLLTSEGEADQANARESAQGPRIHCVFLLLGLPPIASVQSGSTRLFRCTGGGRAAHRWKCLRHLLGVGRTARTDVDTDSGVEPTGRIAARRTAVTPGDLDTVSTPGPHTTAGKNVPARSPNARSALATAGQLRLGRYVEIPNPRTGESI